MAAKTRTSYVIYVIYLLICLSIQIPDYQPLVLFGFPPLLYYTSPLSAAILTTFPFFSDLLKRF